MIHHPWKVVPLESCLCRRMNKPTCWVKPCLGQDQGWTRSPFFRTGHIWIPGCTWDRRAVWCPSEERQDQLLQPREAADDPGPRCDRAVTGNTCSHHVGGLARVILAPQPVLCACHRAITTGKILLSRIQCFVNLITC